MSFEVRRGTLVQFNSSDWTAMVQLDGADLEALMPVAQWVEAQMMTVNSELAVLVFGGTNTDDGIVLGPYGAVGIQDLATGSSPTFAGLQLNGSLVVGTASNDGRITVNALSAATGGTVSVITLAARSTGTPAANFGVRILMQAEDDAADNALHAQGEIRSFWVTPTDGSQRGRIILFASDNTTDREVLRGQTDGTNALIGFLGAAAVARASAYTQTYATTTRTHANVTAVDPAAYAAGANGYSTAAMAQAVHAEVIALRADLVVVKNLLNSVIDDLQALGLVG